MAVITFNREKSVYFQRTKITIVQENLRINTAKIHLPLLHQP